MKETPRRRINVTSSFKKCPRATDQLGIKNGGEGGRSYLHANTPFHCMLLDNGQIFKDDTRYLLQWASSWDPKIIPNFFQFLLKQIF